MRFPQALSAILLAAAAASLAACSSDSDVVSRSDCEQLRDHMIDLRMQAVTADHEQHRVLMQSSLDEAFISACVERTTGTDLRCALAAADTEGLAACSGRTQ